MITIKKLSKEELAEGLTADMVNNLPYDSNYSPIQLKAGDEPVTTLICSKGYWVKADGEFIKDTNGKLLIFSEKECRIGRARYLLNFGEKEKEDKINALVANWKRQIDDKISELQKKNDEIMILATLPDNHIVSAIVKHEKTEEEIQYFKEIHQDKFERLDAYLSSVKSLRNDGKFIELLELFDIRKFDSLMLTAHYDNSVEIAILKNTFGADQLLKWDGDILNRYAAIEI